MVNPDPGPKELLGIALARLREAQSMLKALHECTHENDPAAFDLEIAAERAHEAIGHAERVIDRTRPPRPRLQVAARE